MQTDDTVVPNVSTNNFNGGGGYSRNPVKRMKRQNFQRKPTPSSPRNPRSARQRQNLFQTLDTDTDTDSSDSTRNSDDQNNDYSPASPPASPSTSDGRHDVDERRQPLTARQLAKRKSEKLRRAIRANLRELLNNQYNEHLPEPVWHEHSEKREFIETHSRTIVALEKTVAESTAKITEYKNEMAKIAEKIQELEQNQTKAREEITVLGRWKDELQRELDSVVTDHPKLYGNVQTIRLMQTVMNVTSANDDSVAAAAAAATSANALVDDVWFVSTEKCAVCHSANVHPVKIRNCSHYVCKNCIGQLVQISKSCPICRGHIGEVEQFDVTTLKTTICHVDDCNFVLLRGAAAHDIDDRAMDTATAAAATIAAASVAAQVAGDIDYGSGGPVRVVSPTLRVRYKADTASLRRQIILDEMSGDDDDSVVEIIELDANTEYRMLMFMDFYKLLYTTSQTLLAQSTFTWATLNPLQQQFERDFLFWGNRVPTATTRRLQSFRSKYPVNSIERNLMGNVYERYIRSLNTHADNYLIPIDHLKDDLLKVSQWLFHLVRNVHNFNEEFRHANRLDPSTVDVQNYYCLYRALFDK